MIFDFEDFLKEGKIPKEYLTAPTRADKERMKSEIKKHKNKADDDPSAYKDWVADHKGGDTKKDRHETKPSPATIAYKKKFKKNENFSSFDDFLEEKRKTKNSPEWKDSDAPDAEGKFRDLGIRALARWLIKTRKGDLKKISGSLSQQVVFNRGEDPSYAEKMEKVRKEVYRQLGRKDLLDENEIFEAKQEAWKTALKNKEKEAGIPYKFLKQVYDKGLAAWKTGHKPGVSQHQWAMARVNSWITGEGGARKADQHVWDDYKDWEKTNESAIFPHEIKSESYWRKIISTVPNIPNRKKATEILDTVMKKQGGFASERQMEVLRRAQKGDTRPYNTKN